MTVEQRFEQTDFSQLSQVKDRLLLNLQLRRRVINEEMSLDELDNVAAAGHRGYPNLHDVQDYKSPCK